MPADVIEVDFTAAREEAQAKGLDLAYVKIGFHTGPGGNALREAGGGVRRPLRIRVGRDETPRTETFTTLSCCY